MIVKASGPYNSTVNETVTEVAEAPPVVRSTAIARLWACVLLLASLALLCVALWVKPSPTGYGTHQQLGFGKYRLAPCGMLLTTGYPCPTCGMTTAFAHTVRGQWLRAIWAQPSGFLLALATMVTAAASAGTFVTGRNPLRTLILYVTPYRLFATLLILLFGGWFFRLAVTYFSR
jgi:hypothetical protein